MGRADGCRRVWTVVILVCWVAQVLPGAVARAEPGARVLIFDDGATAALAAPRLVAAGFAVTTTGHVHYFQGDGPRLEDFDAVVVFDGYRYPESGIPPAGQRALSAYVESGGGLLLSELIGFEAVRGGNQELALAGLMLVRARGTALGSDTYQVVVDHPVTEGLPSPFTLGYHGYGVLEATGGTVVVRGTGSGAAVTVAEVGRGRVAHLAMAGSFAGYNGAWSPEFTELFARSVSWLAAGGHTADGTPPHPFTPTVTPAGWSDNPWVVLSFHTTDDGGPVARYELSTGGGPFQEVTSPHLLGPLADGIHLLLVRAYDRAGNYTDGLAWAYVDTGLPWLELDLGSPAHGHYLTSQNRLQLRYGDDESGVAAVTLWTGAGPEDPDLHFTLGAGDGRRTVTAQVTDRAGNSATRSWELWVDDTPPRTTGRAPAGWQSQPVTVELWAEDAGVGVGATYCRWAGQDPWTRSATVSTAGDGRHRLEFYSVDQLGNAEAVQELEVWVDSTPPEACLEGVAPSYVTGQEVTFTVRASDSGSGLERATLLLNGEVCAELAPGPEYTRHTLGRLGVGRYLVAVNAQDWAGNTAVAAAEFEVGPAGQPEYPRGRVPQELPPAERRAEPAQTAAGRPSPPEKPEVGGPPHRAY